MRLMELSGELLAGHFFEGVPGLQFMSPAAFEELQRGLDEDVVYVLNATDPASLCGMAVEGLKERLPSRVASTHLVFCGREVVVLTRKTGKEWEIRVAPDDAELPRYLEPLHRMLTRDVDPRPSFGVDTINGEAATRSVYLPALRRVFDVSADPRRVTLWKKT
jgi:ATP-dependent Lhr-like helicase